jgi:Flp pilus assembly protein TadD
VWQPLHATNTGNDALTAAASGHMQTAIADARAAADENPVAVDPLFDLGAFYHSVGDDGSARSTYLSAISRQPQNFETWLQYAQFELRTGHPEQAVAPALKAERLNLTSLPAHLAAKQARRQTAGGGP